MSGCLFGVAITSYVFMNAFVLAFGVWCIICPETADAVLMVYTCDIFVFNRRLSNCSVIYAIINLLKVQVTAL